jgi:hypothetical protein
VRVQGGSSAASPLEYSAYAQVPVECCAAQERREAEKREATMTENLIQFESFLGAALPPATLARACERHATEKLRLLSGSVGSSG